ncbi:hypothetical protein B0H14DRAFT_2618360 [Mycena olivaceomarginata]|nr:hypothetical protein B0H14DRAFT_2618360 [Mycena olivaceomarginata]
MSSSHFTLGSNRAKGQFKQSFSIRRNCWKYKLDPHEPIVAAGQQRAPLCASAPAIVPHSSCSRSCSAVGSRHVLAPLLPRNLTVLEKKNVDPRELLSEALRLRSGAANMFWHGRREVILYTFNSHAGNQPFRDAEKPAVLKLNDAGHTSVYFLFLLGLVSIKPLHEQMYTSRINYLRTRLGYFASYIASRSCFSFTVLTPYKSNHPTLDTLWIAGSRTVWTIFIQVFFRPLRHADRAIRSCFQRPGSQGYRPHPDLYRMEVLSKITNSTHLLECVEADFPPQENSRFLSERVMHTEAVRAASKCETSWESIRACFSTPLFCREADFADSVDHSAGLINADVGAGCLGLSSKPTLRPGLEMSAVHTIMAAFVHVVKGMGLWADVSRVRVWDDAMRAGCDAQRACPIFLHISYSSDLFDLANGMIIFPLSLFRQTLRSKKLDRPSSYFKPGSGWTRCCEPVQPLRWMLSHFTAAIHWAAG